MYVLSRSSSSVAWAEIINITDTALLQWHSCAAGCHTRHSSCSFIITFKKRNTISKQVHIRYIHILEEWSSNSANLMVNEIVTWHYPVNQQFQYYSQESHNCARVQVLTNHFFIYICRESELWKNCELTKQHREIVSILTSLCVCVCIYTCIYDIVYFAIINNGDLEPLPDSDEFSAMNSFNFSLIAARSLRGGAESKNDSISEFSGESISRLPA